jgi:hypothetical protein
MLFYFHTFALKIAQKTVKYRLTLGFMVLLSCLNACISVPDFFTLTPKKPTVYTGRFSVNYFKSAVLTREQGSFEWKITDSNTIDIKPMQLSLLSPFNTTIALITLNPNASSEQRASLKTPNETIYDTDLDSLMNTVLGWELPLSTLSSWLNQGLLTQDTLISDDWTLQIINRHESKSPKLIIATSALKQITARIVLDDVVK